MVPLGQGSRLSRWKRWLTLRLSETTQGHLGPAPGVSQPIGGGKSERHSPTHTPEPGGTGKTLCAPSQDQPCSKQTLPRQKPTNASPHTNRAILAQTQVHTPKPTWNTQECIHAHTHSFPAHLPTPTYSFWGLLGLLCQGAFFPHPSAQGSFNFSSGSS